MLPQGERSGISAQARRRLFAVVAVALASAAGDAAAQKKQGPIRYEEHSRSRILYYEESGGMMVRPAAPVASVDEAAPRKSARPAAEPSRDRATSTSTSTSASARRTAPRGEPVAAK